MRKGQWRGTTHGFDANLVVDLDENDGLLSGSAYLFPRDPALPSSLAIIERINPDDFKSFTAITFPVDRYGRVIDDESVREHLYPGTLHGGIAELKFSPSDGNNIEIEYSTSVSQGSGKIVYSSPGESSRISADEGVESWTAFKEFVSGLALNSNSKMMFRGQAQPWPLRTSFHRTKRSDLRRYVNSDLPQIHRYLSPLLSHYFDLNDPMQTGAFYNLLQHHGFPTPLLDWTLSPYIAAFFAFHDENAKSSEKIRIFCFEKELWQSKFIQLSGIANMNSHFSINELLGIGNLRMVPQQAVSTLTNVDDVETFIMSSESQAGKKFLSAIDINASDREVALSELDLMGINESTLFPGIDATCQRLKRLLF